MRLTILQRSILAAAAFVWLEAGSAVQAEFFDYEPPTYTAGVLLGNGWNIIDNGVSEPSDPDITVAVDHPCADPYGGTQYLSFAATTVYKSADHSLPSTDSGIVLVEYANHYLGPGNSSGKLMATNTAAGDTLLGVGVDNGGTGPNWLVAHGAGGTNRIYGPELPNAGWFHIRVELDLDSDTADVMWRQTTAGPWIPIINDYATNDYALDGFRLENRKEAVGFDNVYIGDMDGKPEPPQPAAPRYTFMQFSDVHVGNDMNKPVHTRLQAAVALANTLNPDFVVSTGDMTDNPVRGVTPESLAEFTEYNQYTDVLNMPIYDVPGNHDISYFNAENDPRGIAWGDYDTLTAYFEQTIGPLNQSFVHKNGRFILANNVGEYSRMPGYLSQAQLTWIESEMNAAQQNREDIFIFVHIPTVTTNGTDEPWGASSEMLVNLCNQYEAELVTFGHGHESFQLVLDDVLYNECPDLSVEGHETVFEYRVFADRFELWAYNVFDATSGALVGNFDMNGLDLPPGDINGDRVVNLNDLAAIASDWQEVNCTTCGRTDLTADGNVDMLDLVELATHWLGTI